MIDETKQQKETENHNTVRLGLQMTWKLRGNTRALTQLYGISNSAMQLQLQIALEGVLCSRKKRGVWVAKKDICLASSVFAMNSNLEPLLTGDKNNYR